MKQRLLGVLDRVFDCRMTNDAAMMSSTNMNNDTPPPILVKLGLWGIKTRATATAFIWICVGIAIVSAIRHFWIGLVMLLAAAWYWYAMRWVDKHGGWK